MMHNDDRPIGRFFELGGKRSALFGASATASLAPRASAQATEGGEVPAAPDCVAQPEQTEGPYFVDHVLERSDIRHDPATGRISPGAPLALQFVLSRVTPAGTCAVLSGAQVDIWHCDALGVYSDARDRTTDTIGQQFLRGYQVTDGEGSFASTRSTRAGIKAERSIFISRYACPGTAAAPTSSHRSCTFPTISAIVCMRQSRMLRRKDSVYSIPAT